MSNTIKIPLFNIEKADEEIKKYGKKKKFLRDRFVFEYLKLLATGEDNATQAAKNAGYAESGAKHQACRLMKDIQVKTAIEQEREKLTDELRIDNVFLAKKAVKMMEIEEGKQSRRCLVKCKDGEYVANHRYYDSNGFAKSIEILGKLTGSFSEKKEVDHSFSFDGLKENEKNLDTLLDSVE